MSPQHDFDTDTDTLTADPELDEPRQYEVMLLNDDYTTMDFVVDVLMRFFNKDPLEAEEIMYQVHEQGSGVCGIYPFDIAESKVNQVTDHARANNYPLLCVLRPH
ncbi:MAG: ATP-dependent Clp protease adapter ClpS [Cardiobacterium sp.]|jgi:ATP-dependent clp protease adaptor protein clpS|uniref:ATP-dependent Clp protease adapter ClpS n=1 Tax=uncultured Cardiobacterium sp. TaxID=417619 RepID=UPI00263156C0|nr:ATP-dependent Clp protease adapter ClpS [uncultured Cardiobacterium sp.]